MSNNISFSADQFDIDFSTQRALEPGIHVAVDLAPPEKGSLTGKKDKEEYKYVDYNYTDSEGNYIRKRVFSPKRKADDSNLYLINGETSKDQAWVRTVKERMAEHLAVAKIFLDDDVVKQLASDSYDGFVDKVLALLTPQILLTQKLNLKVILDSDCEYSMVPAIKGYYDKSGKLQLKCRFLEGYVEGQEPKIFLSKYERDERTQRADSKGERAPSDATTPKVDENFIDDIV